MIEHGNIEVKRDKSGMWLHPAFPWNIVKEDTDIRPDLKKWGYKGCFRTLDNDAPDEIVERYAKSNDPDCSYWTPTKPDGDGWILGAIYDTEDSPVALWLKPSNGAAHRQPPITNKDSNAK
jgi:hypothetical protein